jgi:hypothetical protein
MEALARLGRQLAAKSLCLAAGMGASKGPWRG